MMRWMEALVERTGSGALPTIQKLWGAERTQPEIHDPALERSGGATEAINCLLSLAALVLSFPVLVIIALLIWLTSRGPVLYTQVRVGLDRRQPIRGAQNHRRERDLGGRPFTIYKFRTMWLDAEHHSGAVWAQQRDPRVTP
ncbi:MAG: sugar transferase, partial [Gemmatimonadales bacterium]